MLSVFQTDANGEQFGGISVRVAAGADLETFNTMNTFAAFTGIAISDGFMTSHGGGVGFTEVAVTLGNLVPMPEGYDPLDRLRDFGTRFSSIRSPLRTNGVYALPCPPGTTCDYAAACHHVAVLPRPW